MGLHLPSSATAARDPRIAEATAWARELALPLWAGAGREPHGGFHEKLTLQGAPDAGAVRRVRVQARQIYVYSHAACLGWREDGGDIASAALERLLATAAGGRPDEGWAHLLNPDGSVRSPTRDLYDHAFILLGLAWLIRAGNGQAANLADRTFAFVERRLADTAAGGWLEGDPASLPRRQNPHMHMLEALLALHGATGEARWLAPAGRIVDLFSQRFFDAGTGTLREFFTRDWGLAAGAEGRRVEPGHHMEWVWLLREYERVSGADLGAQADALYAWALRRGVDPDSGFLYDGVDVDHGPVLRSRRAWPQTELVKAHFAQARAGVEDAFEQGCASLAALKKVYLDPAPPGGWIDRFDEGGRAVVSDIPASTFYHLFGAIAAAHEADSDRSALPSIQP